jgi:hypothetical protein
MPTWGYKDINDDISFTGDELFRAYQKTSKMSKDETYDLFVAFQKALGEAVDEEARELGHVATETGEEPDTTFQNPLWEQWERKGKHLQLSTPHGFLPTEYERPQQQSAAKEATSPMPGTFLKIAHANTANNLADHWKETAAAHANHEEASMNPIDITLQDLQKWRDDHEKKVADLRIQAAIEAEEMQQASSVAVPGFEWTGLTGVEHAAAPDGFIAVTIHERGPLGVEVEWTVPPKFVAVIPGSLAYLAGLRAGDELAQVDQADVRDWGGDRIAPLLAMRPLHLSVIRVAGQLQDGQVGSQAPGMASLDDIQLELDNNSPPRNGEPPYPPV